MGYEKFQGSGAKGGKEEVSETLCSCVLVYLHSKNWSLFSLSLHAIDYDRNLFPSSPPPHSSPSTPSREQRQTQADRSIQYHTLSFFFNVYPFSTPSVQSSIPWAHPDLFSIPRLSIFLPLNSHSSTHHFSPLNPTNQSPQQCLLQRPSQVRRAASGVSPTATPTAIA